MRRFEFSRPATPSPRRDRLHSGLWSAATYDTQPDRNAILNLTDEDDPSEQISRIEAQLEALAEVAERCRKAILVSKAAIAGGVAVPLLMLLGLLGSNAIAAIGSIAAVLGGIVWLGSNLSTLQQTTAAIGAAEALRSDLIGRIDLRVVGDSGKAH
jgi:hypothetical protein